MNFSSMIDPSTLAIVLGGTVLATFLRAGWADWRAMLSQLGRALAGAFGMAKPFDAEALRGRIARELQGMQRDGLLRAEPHLVGDAEFDTAIRDMVTHRSTAGLKGLLEQLREKRLAPARAAVNTLGLSAELAPVFGLGGTLISLSRLPANGVDRTAYMSAIGMAVHATLYGLVLAHLLLAPLARLVERRMTHEDNARKALAQWLEAEVAEAAPGALTPAPKAAKPIRAVNVPHAVKPRCVTVRRPASSSRAVRHEHSRRHRLANHAGRPFPDPLHGHRRRHGRAHRAGQQGPGRSSGAPSAAAPTATQARA